MKKKSLINKKILIWISVIVFILLILLLLLVLKTSNSNDSNNNLNKDIITLEKEVKEEVIKYNFYDVIESKIINNCDNLVDEDLDKSSLCKDKINFKLAFEKNEPLFCWKIVNKKIQFKCKVELNKQLYNLWIKDNNNELCLLISIEKSKIECSKKVDEHYYELNDCKNIYDKNYKLQCWDKIDSENFLKAKEANNKELCNSLSTDLLVNDCIDSIENKIYLSANSLESCNQLKSDTLRKKCIKRVIFLSWDYDKSSDDFCKELDKWEYKIKCFDWYYFNKVRSWLSNLNSTCNEIENLELKNSCLSIIEKRSNIEKIENESEKLKESWDIIWSINLNCESKKQWSDIDICKREELTKKAISDNDISVCNNLENNTLKDWCISSATFEIDSIIFKKAIAEKNIELCNELTTQEKKDFCLDYINK